MHDPAEGETLMGALLAPRTFDRGWARAIEASCALHEMQSAKDPVLLMWTRKPDDVLSWWHTVAILVWLVSSAVHLVVAAILWTFVTASFPHPKVPSAIRRQRLPLSYPREPGAPGGTGRVRAALPHRLAADAAPGPHCLRSG